MAIIYVGGQVGSFAGTNSAQTITFALTNGTDSVPKANDLVVVSYGVGSTADEALTIQNGSAVNYTLIGSELYQNDLFDSNLRVAYRFMPATPETTTVLSGTGGVQNAGAYTIHVYRGVAPTTPLDVTAVTAGNINTRLADPGSITPTTAGAWIHIVGSAACDIGGTYTAAYLTDLRVTTQADTNDVNIASGYVAWTSGAYDPAAFGGGGTDTVNDSWTAVTVALRPQALPITNVPPPVTPFVQRMGVLFLLPNLMMTTLAPAPVVQLPPGEQVSTSCPRAKYQVQCDNYVQPLTIRSIPNPDVRRLSDSAPPPKAAVYAEQQQNTLARGINPNPAARQLSDSAPPLKAPVYAAQQHNILAQGINPNPSVEMLDASAPSVKYRPQVDGTPNLLATTLAPPSAVFPAGAQVYGSAPPLKSPVVAVQQHNILAQGINPNPAVSRLFDSAPWVKYQPHIDPYRNITLSLSLVFPVGDQWSESSPPRKFSVVAYQQHNILAQGIVGNPGVIRLSGSAPFSRERPRSDTYANLNLTTLATAPPAGALPVGMQAFVSAPSRGLGGYHLLFPQNLLTSTLATSPIIPPVLPPVPPPVIVPPPLIDPLVGVSPTVVTRPAGRTVAAVDYLDGERARVRFDFISSLARGDTITAQTVTATVYTGFDPAPATLLIGLATTAGTMVDQIVHTNTVGVIYQLRCQVTTVSGSKVQMTSFFTGPGPKGA